MPPSKSLAMVQTAPRKLEAQDLPIPEIGDDDALLRLEACGICGSDYEQFEGVLRTPMPVVPGHEPLGVIEKDSFTTIFTDFSGDALPDLYFSVDHTTDFFSDVFSFIRHSSNFTTRYRETKFSKAEFSLIFVKIHGK